MVYFSRTKAAAILLTVFVLCGFTVPNFFSEETVKSWPAWAQRRLVLGPDVQGGSSILLEVNRGDVRAQLLESLLHEVRRTLREAQVSWLNRPIVRGNGVEVMLRDGDFRAGFSKLRELSQPFNGVREFDVVDAGDGLVRLTPTEAAIAERTHLTVDRSIPVMERRFNEIGLVEATVQRQGSGRILVQVPGYGDPLRPGVIPIVE